LNRRGDYLNGRKVRNTPPRGGMVVDRVGHYCNLTMIFDQGMDGTTLRVTWDGVPVGEEDVTKRNFREYYVNNIK